MNLAELDAKVDFDKLDKEIKEAEQNNGVGDFPEVPKGLYFAKLEKLELGETKDQRPMVKWQFRLVDAATDDNIKDAGYRYPKGLTDNDEALDFFDNYKGKKKPCVFMNRVIYGTKNDANMISSVVGWLQKLECDFDVSFHGYSDFAEVIMDVAEDVDGAEMLVLYNPDAFNSVTLIEVYGD